MKRRAAQKLDVLCAGKLYIDVIFTGLPRLPIRGEEILAKNIGVSLGGGAAVCAVGVSRLGLKTGVMGAIVPSLFGHYIVHTLKAHGVNVDSLVRVDAGENNISVSLNASHDRSMIAFAGIDDFYELDNKKKKTILLSKHLHVKGLNKQRAGFLKFAKDNNLTTSLDINLQTPNHADMVRKILPYVDLFLPSAWEMRTLFDRPPRQMVKEFGKLTREYCVIKLGRKGSIASDGSSIIEQAANPTTVLDATGAGDAFDAGFLWAYLQKGSIRNCLRAGTVTAELCLQTAGGIGWVTQLNKFSDLMGSDNVNPFQQQ